VPLALPPTYTTSGQLLFPNGDSSNVAANTQIDLQRFQSDLSDLTPGHEVQLLSTGVISRDFQNGYIGTYTLGVDHDLGGVKMSAAYVGTSGVHLSSVIYPNGYAGAEAAYAPYTQFNSAGQAIGGFGPEAVMATGSHSSYNALQTSATENASRIGLSFQASYTFSKSIDDTSAVLGGSSSGVIALTSPQDPRNARADRGPSTFDVTHVFSLSLIQSLPFDRVSFLKPLGRYVTGGWQFLNITSLTLIKNTPLGHRGHGELGILQFRAEFFNVFNIVNFGLPSNIVMGSGFGMISHTAGPSRQIQFSLKLVY